MKDIIKKILSVVCFTTLLFLMISKLTMMFYPKAATYETYETLADMQKDTVDVLALGTSSTYNAWVIPEIWEESGISMFTVATSAQPFALTTQIIEEATSNQSPKVIMIDLHGFRRQTFNYSQSKVRPVTDCFSIINKFKYIDDMLNDAEEYSEETGKKNDLDNEDFSYYFPIIKYHSTWEEGITQERMMGQKSKYLGYYFVLGNRRIDKTEVTTDTTQLLDSQKEALDELIAYAKEHTEYKFLFTCMPSQLTYEEQVDINTAIEIIEKNGFPVVNMNTDEMYNELEFSFDKHLRDRNHVNIFGAEIVTEYMINYLKDNYELKDHRGDEKYDAWQQAADTFNLNYDNYMKGQMKQPVPNRIEYLGGNKIKFLWNRTYCGDGYYVYKKVGKDGNWEKCGEVKGGHINYFVDTVNTGEITYYSIEVYKEYKEKKYCSGYTKNGIAIRSMEK